MALDLLFSIFLRVSKHTYPAITPLYLKYGGSRLRTNNYVSSCFDICNDWLNLSQGVFFLFSVARPVWTPLTRRCLSTCPPLWHSWWMGVRVETNQPFLHLQKSSFRSFRPSLRVGNECIFPFRSSLNYAVKWRILCPSFEGLDSDTAQSAVNHRNNSFWIRNVHVFSVITPLTQRRPASLFPPLTCFRSLGSIPPRSRRLPYTSRLLIGTRAETMS